MEVREGARLGSKCLMWDSLEMPTVTGTWSGVSAPVSQAVGKAAKVVQCVVEGTSP